MNFFNSIFADDDPDPPKSPKPESPSSSSSNPTQTHQPESPITDGSDQVWSFGGLIKTLQVKSDWIDTYKRDLQEFGSGLKKETQVFREVASKSLDLGAAKAQVSLESVGQAIDTLGSIISQGKDSLLSLDNDLSDNINNNNNNFQSVNNSSERKYSRFDAQLSAIQRDLSTFVEDPDDVDEYKKWKSGFNLKEKSEEIDGLLRDNGSLDGIYKRVVPETVDPDEFWCRYYYRVHRLKEAENVRAKLVKRAISTEDDEELSWDVDDEDEEDEEEGDVKRVDEGSVSKSGDAAQEEDNEKGKEGSSDRDLGVKSSVSTDQGVDMKDKVEKEEKSDVIESATNEVSSNKEVQSEGTSEVKNGEESKKSGEKAASEGKKEPSESGKDSDISVVSMQPSHEDDDMGWDEIEDVGSGDENKVAARSESPNREELRKRLSAADEDEDLSWDIEDDD